ncbi:hypothetical protein BH10ACI1_BH10ACI1_07310 [soil metagenome]
MRRFLLMACLVFSVALSSISAIAQNVETEGELFNKISALTKTKKAEDQEKAYKLSKIFLQKFGKADSAETKKIREFVANHEASKMGKLVEDGKTSEAFAFGKEILAATPDNSDVTMLLAYAGYQALIKKQDKSFGKDSIEYAKTTLKLFGENKLPQQFAPFANQNDATAFMYYIAGRFMADDNLPEAANYFYKAVQMDSKVKDDATPYYYIALNYHKMYEKLSADFETKHGKKTVEDDAMRADNEKLEKLLNLMMDAYARAAKLGEAQKLPNAANWKTIFSQIYTGLKQSDAGMSEYLDKVLTTPLPDPSTF